MALPNDVWDDDDLDFLGDNQLAELEHNAIQFTQQHQQQVQQPRHNNARRDSNRNGNGYARQGHMGSDYGDEDFEDDDLDDGIVYDANTQVIPVEVQKVQVKQRNGHVKAREQFRQDRYGGDTTSTSYHNINHITARSDASHFLPSPAVSSTKIDKTLPVDAQPANANPYDTQALESLQRQVQDLLRAQESYKAELSAKAGEIAIVRSKSEKIAKEYEREVHTLKRLNAEKVAAQQKVIEAARDAEKTLATELEFVKKDLTEEVEKVRNLKRTKDKDATEGTLKKVETPKKKKPMADGFEDDEITIISPTKFRGRRSNGGTPTKAASKRKRKAQDSPARALDLEVDVDMQGVVEQESLKSEHLIRTVGRDLRLPDDRLKFLESVLTYRPVESKFRILEELAHISFPNAPKESFASFILNRLPTAQQPSNEFAIQLCELFVTLWTRCLKEEFYKPIDLLVSLLTYAIELKTIAISPYIIDTLLPTAQATVEEIAIPRFKREISERTQSINITKTLQLIHLTGQGCMSHRDQTRRFWHLMRMDFFLMMLSLNQHIEDIDIVLQLLSMSTLMESLGPLDTRPPQKNAIWLLDRITYMFVNEPYSWPATITDPSQQPFVNEDTPPSPPHKSKNKIPRHKTSKLRISALRCLTSFLCTTWGRETVAKHTHTIGRLVALLSDEIDTLYNNLPDHTLSVHQINLTTRILHILLARTPTVSINIPEKLVSISGGTQKHILALSRLYFAEQDGALETGIEECVQEFAKELLELAVTPQEGEGVYEAFYDGL